jgi:glycosidase
MTHWLGRGIDGWRLDAAFAPGAAAWCTRADIIPMSVG